MNNLLNRYYQEWQHLTHIYSWTFCDMLDEKELKRAKRIEHYLLKKRILEPDSKHFTK